MNRILFIAASKKSKYTRYLNIENFYCRIYSIETIAKRIYTFVTVKGLRSVSLYQFGNHRHLSYIIE